MPHLRESDCRLTAPFRNNGAIMQDFKESLIHRNLKQDRDARALFVGHIPLTGPRYWHGLLLRELAVKRGQAA
ncbi:MAG: hypothetical protein ACRDJ9_08090 [Dehalococcoidia bacterium]